MMNRGGSGEERSRARPGGGGGWPCEVVIASIREASDFAGLPVVVDGGVRFAPPR